MIVTFFTKILSYSFLHNYTTKPTFKQRVAFHIMFERTYEKEKFHWEKPFQNIKSYKECEDRITDSYTQKIEDIELRVRIF